MKGKIKGCLIFGVIFCAEGPHFHYWGWNSPKRRKPPLTRASAIGDFHFAFMRASVCPLLFLKLGKRCSSGSGLCVWNTKYFPVFKKGKREALRMATWFVSSVPLVNASWERSHLYPGFVCGIWWIVRRDVQETCCSSLQKLRQTGRKLSAECLQRDGPGPLEDLWSHSDWVLQWWLTYWNFLPPAHRVSGAQSVWALGAWSRLFLISSWRAWYRQILIFPSHLHSIEFHTEKRQRVTPDESMRRIPPPHPPTEMEHTWLVALNAEVLPDQSTAHARHFPPLRLKTKVWRYLTWVWGSIQMLPLKGRNILIPKRDT